MKNTMNVDVCAHILRFCNIKSIFATERTCKAFLHASMQLVAEMRQQIQPPTEFDKFAVVLYKQVVSKLKYPINSNDSVSAKQYDFYKQQIPNFSKKYVHFAFGAGFDYNYLVNTSVYVGKDYFVQVHYSYDWDAPFWWYMVAGMVSQNCYADIVLRVKMINFPSCDIKYGEPMAAKWKFYDQVVESTSSADGCIKILQFANSTDKPSIIKMSEEK